MIYWLFTLPILQEIMNILYLFQNLLGYTIVTMFLTVNLNKFRISYFTHTVPELTRFFFKATCSLQS
jgi:hypothetical protein